MDNQFLESFYESVILPRYGTDVELHELRWKDHGQVGPDAWAHHFETNDGRHFTLLYEDFPDGSYFADDVTHEIMKSGNLESLELCFQDESALIPNVTGHFTLYREK